MPGYTFSNTPKQPKSEMRERLAVSNSAVPITAATYTDSSTALGVRALANAAVLQVLTNPIYWTLDGSTPSASVGFQNSPGDFIYLDSAQKIAAFLAIRQAGDAALEILPLWGETR